MTMLVSALLPRYLTFTKRMSCGWLALHLAMVLVETLKVEMSAGGGML